MFLLISPWNLKIFKIGECRTINDKINYISKDRKIDNLIKFGQNSIIANIQIIKNSIF